MILPQGEEKVRAVREMFDAIAPRYELVNRVIALGLDTRWRRATVRSLRLGPGAAVLDVASGTGDLCRELPRCGYRAVGVDFSMGMLLHAHTDAPLVQGDAARLPLADGAVDGVVSGFGLRNFADLGAVLHEIARVVRAGGRIALLDLAAPRNPILRAGHAVYFQRVVPRLGGLISDPDAYGYLPRSVAYLPAAPELVRRVEAAGFGAVSWRALSGGIVQLIVATRRVETAAERGIPG